MVLILGAPLLTMSWAYFNFPHHIISAWTASLISSLCRGSNNLLLIIPLTWCRRWLTTSAWNLSTIVSWSSSTLWALPGIQLNSWWVIPSLPLDDSCSHRPLYCIPSNTKLVPVLCYTLSSLLSNICSSLPWSITIFYIQDVVLSTPGRRPYWL